MKVDKKIIPLLNSVESDLVIFDLNSISRKLFQSHVSRNVFLVESLVAVLWITREPLNNDK